MTDTRPELTERRRAALARMERLSRLTDSGLRIPGTELRFGLDAVLGLIPVAGDLAGLVFSLYLYIQARDVGAPWSVRRRMLRNVLVDLLGGLVPVVGDVFDVAWRANSRNTELLRSWLHETLVPPVREKKADRLLWLLLIAAAVAVLLFLFWPHGAARL